MTARCTCADAIARPDPRCPVHSPRASPWPLEIIAADRAATRALERLAVAVVAALLVIGGTAWLAFLGVTP